MKKQKLQKVKLPSIDVQGEKHLTIFFVGNIDKGFIPTAEDLHRYKELIMQALKEEQGYIIVPHGTLTIKQIKISEKKK